MKLSCLAALFITALVVTHGTVSAGTAPPAEAASTTRLHSSEWMLRSGSEEEQIGEPASFSYSNDTENGSGTEFAADFFLGWTSVLENAGKFAAEPHFSLEGHLNSADDEAGDAWRLRAGADLYSYWGDGTGFVQGSYLKLYLKDEANRDLDYQRLSAELLWSPTIPSLHIGNYRGGERIALGAGGHRENRPPVELRWRPYLGIDAGGTIAEDASVTEESSLRLVAKAVVEINLNFLSKLYDKANASIYLEDTFHYLTDGGDGHNFVKASFVTMLTEDVGINVAYKVGESSPDYKKLGLITAGVSIKFGGPSD